MASTFSFDAAGYFLRDDQRFVPFGVNYWPASCGAEMWRRWPEGEVRADVQRIAGLGMNTIRVFLRWQDFEPQAGEIVPEMWQRLGQLLVWCREASLAVHPVLFGGCMAGGESWPEWVAERNLYADSLVVERAEQFALLAARRLHSVSHSVIALDLGDQLVQSAHTGAARPAHIAAWCEVISRAIRSSWRDVLIGVGNDHQQITTDRGWRLGRQPGANYLSVQCDPVPTSHPLGFDGLTDAFGRSLLPAYVNIARAWGPVLVQGFGTGALAGGHQADAYLRAVLPETWEAGANGVVWSSLYDVPPHGPSLSGTGATYPTGLLDQTGAIKPGLDYVVEFGRSLATRPLPSPDPDAWGMYVPRYFYLRDEPANPGNTPGAVMGRLLLAQHFLRQSGGSWITVRGERPLPEYVRRLFIAGALVTAAEAEALRDWVEAGGELFWHGPDPKNWGREYVDLLGARPVDYRSVRGVSVNAFGERFTFGHFPRDLRVEVEATTGTVLARDHQEIPVLIENRIGAGRVRAALPLIEDAIAPVASHPTARDRWASWYRGFMEL